MDFKLAYTKDKNQIQKSLDSGVIDSGDMVLVMNENSNDATLAFINNDKRILFVNSVQPSFDSLQEANEWLGTQQSPNLGSTVSIITDGKYVVYTINQSPDGGYILEPSTSGGGGSLSWNEF